MFETSYPVLPARRKRFELAAVAAVFVMVISVLVPTRLISYDLDLWMAIFGISVGISSLWSP